MSLFSGLPMLLVAWCIAEITRYLFYVLALYNACPSILIWCRYSFFLILYPTGVSVSFCATSSMRYAASLLLTRILLLQLLLIDSRVNSFQCTLRCLTSRRRACWHMNCQTNSTFHSIINCSWSLSCWPTSPASPRCTATCSSSAPKYSTRRRKKLNKPAVTEYSLLSMILPIIFVWPVGGNLQSFFWMNHLRIQMKAHVRILKRNADCREAHSPHIPLS